MMAVWLVRVPISVTKRDDRLAHHAGGVRGREIARDDDHGLVEPRDDLLACRPSARAAAGRTTNSTSWRRSTMYASRSFGVRRDEELADLLARLRDRPLGALLLVADLLLDALDAASGRRPSSRYASRIGVRLERAGRQRARSPRAGAVLASSHGALQARRPRPRSARLDVPARVGRLRVADDQRRADRDAGLPAMPLRTHAARRARSLGGGRVLRRAGADGGALAHRPSPNLSAMSCADGVDALLGAVARARTSMTVPFDPQSSSTPMTLLPFALWSSRATSTSQGYFDASWTSFVAARAWRPSWLTILKRPARLAHDRPPGALVGGDAAVGAAAPSTPLSSSTLDRSSCVRLGRGTALGRSRSPGRARRRGERRRSGAPTTRESSRASASAMRHRAVAPARAADRDRQVALALALVLAAARTRGAPRCGAGTPASPAAART